MMHNVPITTESTSLAARSLLVACCLAAGFAYRVLIGLFPPSLLQFGVLLGLAALFLAVAVFARRRQNLARYWEIPFAFFVFTIAGVCGDQGGFMQQLFVRNVLHETASVNTPPASTVMGMVIAQLVSTLSLLIPIMLLTKASGSDMKSIYIATSRNRWALVVGVIGFLVFYRVTMSGRAERFFPNNGVTLARFLALTPALLVLVLCNGLREELWFRGLFLKKYAQFLSPLSSNMLSAIIFAAFHAQVTYTPALLPFLGITFLLGLFLGYLMQKSGSVLASVLFHAGSDIPIFLVYLSYASA
jgi:membrane protease YdiL (CAAX protease family)